MDDGSTDGTLEVARQFEPRGVRVATQSNQGAAAARNKALSLSRGDYIQWLDADDLLSRDKIATNARRRAHNRSQFASLRGVSGCVADVFSALCVPAALSYSNLGNNSLQSDGSARDTQAAIAVPHRLAARLLFLRERSAGQLQ